MAEHLHGALNDDPSVPGLRIPTRFIPDDGSGTAPEARISDEADRVVVVLLADDYLAVRARRQAAGGSSWGDYMVRLRQLCDTAPDGHRFMPIQLTEHAWPIDPRLDDVSFLRAWAVEDVDARRRLIARRIVHLLLRRLRPHEVDEDAPSLTIFLSHTKLDLEAEPKVVKALLAHLTASQPQKTWFDSGDIEAGSIFAKEIDRGVKDTALLAVVTDSYSSRSWCRREVLFAKRHQRPVVVVDAVQEREVRRFPYMGNVPVIRWKGDSQRVVDVLLREALRHAYAEEYLKKRMLPGDALLPGGPELVTLVHRDRNQTVLYPDPPLGPEELAIIEATGIRVETPLERHALRNQLGTKDLTVVLSVSPADDIARFGLRRTHLDEVLLEISRYLLISGVRLAYGGHLRADGYTIRLADLLRDPVVEFLRGRDADLSPALPQLVSYLPWPTFASDHDQARLGPLVEVRSGERPADVDETLDAEFRPEIGTDIPADTPPRRFGWARGLTEMREQQVRETSGRIVIGGRSSGYKGRMPGVLEETLLTLTAGKPVYLAGAFGGCAKLVIDALEGIQNAELTRAHHSELPNAKELEALYRQRAQTWLNCDDAFGALASRGMAGLQNGLSVEENRELAVTRSSERIVELILTGLQNVYCKAANAVAGFDG